MGKKTAERRPTPIEIGPVVASTMKRQKGERWYWRARRRDTRETVWTGWATREEAATAIAALVARGLPRSPLVAPTAVRTVGELLDAWCDHQARRNAAGQIADRSLVNYRQAAGYWKDAAGDLLVDALTRAIVEDTITAWQSEGVAPRTAKMGLDALAAAVKWGAARGYCGRLELSRLEALRIRDDDHVNCASTPTPADVGQVIEALEGRFADALRLLAWTGARVGEITALRVSDVDLEARELALSGRDEGRRGKTGRRLFPLDGQLLELVARLVEGRDPAARLLEPKVEEHHLNPRIASACAELELSRFTCHGVRRMAVFRLLDAGVDAQTAAKLFGHSVITLLRNYMRPTPDSLRQAVARGSLSAITAPRGSVVPLSGTTSGHKRRG